MSAAIGYYDKAQDEHDAKHGDAGRRERWLIGIAAGCMLMGLAGIVAMMGAWFNAELVPVVIEVDKQTGLVSVNREVSGRPMVLKEAIDRHFVGRYVNNREAWSADDLGIRYEVVMLLSGAAAGNGYDVEIQQRTRAWGRKLTRQVELLNVSFLAEDVAHVRFKSTFKNRDGSEEKPQHFVAVIGYHYVNESLSDSDRLINFAGFQVKSYRVDTELAR